MGQSLCTICNITNFLEMKFSCLSLSIRNTVHTLKAGTFVGRKLSLIQRSRYLANLSFMSRHFGRYLTNRANNGFFAKTTFAFFRFTFLLGRIARKGQNRESFCPWKFCPWSSFSVIIFSLIFWCHSSIALHFRPIIHYMFQKFEENWRAALFAWLFFFDF